MSFNPKVINVLLRQTIKRVLPGHMPDFLIVGAQKAGTTSLYYYLSQHPNIVASRPKEIRYFDRDENYERGVRWYTHNFPNLKGLGTNYKYFEATPEYLYRSYVAQRIFRFDKNIKIIIILRDPVERAYSAWLTYRQFGRRKKLPEVMYSGHIKGSPNNIYREFYEKVHFPTFEEVIDADIDKFITQSPLEEPAVVRRGVYYPQVKRYYDLFGRQNVLILGFKDLIGAEKVAALNLILRFVGLEPCAWTFLDDQHKNKSKNKEDMLPISRTKLEQFYRAHNHDLFELIGFIPNW